MQVTLENESTNTQGNVIISSGQVLRIGRQDAAELTGKEDLFMSGLHFTIECKDSHCRISDNSRNGTFLNGARIREGILHDGDVITAGQTRFRVRIEDATNEPVQDTAVDTRIALRRPGDLLEVLYGGPGERLYALLDAARDDRVLELLRGSREQYHSLYEGQQGQDLANFAPYLVELPRQSPLLDALIKEGWGKSWGVYLTSNNSFEEVRRHFRHFLLVQTEDGKELYFRFYDPRVLSAFLPTCSPGKRGEFCGPIQQMFAEEDSSAVLCFSVPANFRPKQFKLAPGTARNQQGI